MQANFTDAINQICDEKNISRDVVMETVKAALASAYKKDYGSRDQEVRVEIDEKTGGIDVYIAREVVETVEDAETQMTLPEAKKIKKTAKVGDVVEIHDVPADFGRIAAQTAKQVIIQRIREAERDMVFEEFKDKEASMVNGVVQRVEGDTIIVDLGKAAGVLYRSEQIPSEHYYVGQRIKVYVVRVESSAKGPQIILSRAHPDMIRKLFEMEVPEILAGTIEVKAIAREAGERTKVAVASDQEGVDPVGALVGQRGSRVQSVMAEIGEEKIDIILWDPDVKTFITNALSPAKVTEIEINEEEKKVQVKVPEDQLSLAIGKRGQNVRLAAKLTGWNVDIAGADDAGVEKIAMATATKGKKTADIEDAILKSIESQGTEEADVEDKKEEPTSNMAEAKGGVAVEEIAQNEKATSNSEEKQEEATEEKEETIDEIISEETASAAQEKPENITSEETIEKTPAEDDIVTEEVVDDKEPTIDEVLAEEEKGEAKK